MTNQIHKTIKRIGKYNIVEKLGEGCMGTVYKAYDTLMERYVAIKTINSYVLNEKDAVARFKQEAIAAGNLKHPNIVILYHFEEGDEPLMVMEYIEGQSLDTLFENKQSFSLAEIAQIMEQLLDALQSVHEHENKIVHRDIKPGNIMVHYKSDQTIKIVIMDFGIARLESSELTRDGTTMGTASYMAPEQCKGETVDGRADIFSAAVILYQLLTGEKPFDGENYTAIIHKICNEKQQAVPPSQLNGEIPKAFDIVIEKGLAKNIQQRYLTARDFIDDIKLALTDSEIITHIDNPENQYNKNGTVCNPVYSDKEKYNDGTVFITEQINQEVKQSSAEKLKPDGLTQDKKKSKFPIAGILFIALLAGSFYWFYSHPKMIDFAYSSFQQEILKSSAETKFYVNSTPANASVIVDDVIITDTTPTTLNLSPGYHQLVFVLDGFYDVPVAIEIKDGVEISPLSVNLHQEK